MTEKKDKRGLNPNSRKNLALGRKPNIRTSKQYSITRMIKDMLDEQADVIDANGLTWRQMIARIILRESAKGNTQMIRELLERTDGKVTQPISGDEENPTPINVNVTNNGAKRITESIIEGD